MATTTSEVDALTPVTDVDLVENIYLLVQRINDDDLEDEFYLHLMEAFERFAPRVEAELNRRAVESDRELKQILELMGERRELRLAQATMRMDSGD